MPINDIVGEAAETNGATLMERGDAPSEMNAPDGDPEPTTMNTGPMLPPYLHNQTLKNRGAVSLLGTVMAVMVLVRQVMG